MTELHDDVDDGYLVRRAQEGYLDAFELLLSRYSAPAYRIAYRLLGDESDAQDLAQEALTAAWQGLPRFRRDAAFSTWLYQIVTRRALNKLTRSRRVNTLADLDTVHDPARGPYQSVEHAAAGDAVTAAVAALPLSQRVVVVLHHFEGLSYEDCARVTDSTVAAVRSHLYRARRTLAVTLDSWR